MPIYLTHHVRTTIHGKHVSIHERSCLEDFEQTSAIMSHKDTTQREHGVPNGGFGPKPLLVAAWERTKSMWKGVYILLQIAYML